MTQAEALIHAIRRSRIGMTYLELEMLRVSSCPWRRISESGHRYLREGERLIKEADKQGLVRFRIVRVAVECAA